jgi:hypothetical protein
VPHLFANAVHREQTVRVNLVTNFNGCGLQRDVEMLRPVLEEKGHEVQCVQFNNHHSAQKADLNIFMEVVVPGLFRLAPRQFLFVNPEWYATDWTQYLHAYEKVLCKTDDAFRIFQRLNGCVSKCVKVGFFARDMYDPSVRKVREFVHVAGKSKTKNTEAILECWKVNQLPWTLTVVAESYDESIGHVHFVRRADDVHLRTLMNQAWFHLMPSQYEGYGHSLHESMGCAAVVLTTNQPPMSEVAGLPEDLMIQAVRTQQHNLGMLQFVGSGQVLNAVKKAMFLHEDELEVAGAKARTAFEAERPKFIEEFTKVL